MPNKIVAANWKMNLSLDEASDLARRIKGYSSAIAQTTVLVAAPAVYIPALAQIFVGTAIEYGAQNVNWTESGAFTGELSVPMLSNFGATFALVGHSERRHVFAESIELCVKRAAGALAQKMKVIFCVGETLEQRESGLTNQVIASQLRPLLVNLEDKNLADKLILAYEPVWAIGTGKVAALSDIEAAHAQIDSLVQTELHLSRPILYGGSVTPDNFKDILSVKRVSGGLIGGASLDFAKFARLIDLAKQCNPEQCNPEQCNPEQS